MIKSASASRSVAAFTLVEVMMAAVILTVGFMGLIQAVTICSGMMDQARRQTLAAQILSDEIEQLRQRPWRGGIETLSDLPTTPINASNFPNSPFLSAIQKSGATFELSRKVVHIDPVTNLVSAAATGLREVSFTLSWKIRTSRRDASGELITLSYTRINSAYYGKNGVGLAIQRM